jgi:hypothetical protein
MKVVKSEEPAEIIPKEDRGIYGVQLPVTTLGISQKISRRKKTNLGASQSELSHHAVFTSPYIVANVFDWNAQYDF